MPCLDKPQTVPRVFKVLVIAVAFVTFSGSGEQVYFTGMVHVYTVRILLGLRSLLPQILRKSAFFPQHPRFHPWVVSHGGPHCSANLNPDCY